MRLMSVQPYAVVARLMKGERVSGQPVFDPSDGCDLSMKRAYDWLVAQMSKRPELGSPAGAYPMWAWVVPPQGVEAFIPSMDESDGYRLHLEVPDRLVMCTDYYLWHHVLNDFSIQLYEDEEVEKEQSWHRVLGVDPKTYAYTLTSPDMSFLALDNAPTIQATMWHLDPKWIVSVESTYYEGTKMKSKIREGHPDPAVRAQQMATLFIGACIMILVAGLSWIIRGETIKDEVFIAQCKNLHGIVARHKGVAICVEEDSVIIRQNPEHDHKH